MDAAAETDTAAICRDRLLEAALPHVALDGWTMPALIAGASDLGLKPGHVRAVFADPERDALRHFSDWTDRRMQARMQTVDIDRMRMRERIATAVMLRLEVLSEHKEAMRRACGALVLPQHAGRFPGALYRSVDAIWRQVGDASVDFSFYTRRGLLAAVLAATTLYWIDDSSPEQCDTRAFLDRQIAGIMRISSSGARVKNAVARIIRPRWFRRRLGEF